MVYTTNVEDQQNDIIVEEDLEDPAMVKLFL